jgi:hypothetical protein
VRRLRWCRAVPTRASRGGSPRAATAEGEKRSP